jgi:hypothetical protein
MLAMDKIKIYYNFIFFFFIFFLFPQIIFSDTISASTNVIISAKVISTAGSGSAGSGGYQISTSINFIGKTSPLSKVYLLKDGYIVSETISNTIGNFSISLINLPTSVYLFSLYSQTIDGIESSFYSFPIYITFGSNINVSNIFLSPSLAIDKNQVIIGENLLIYGRAIPYSQITISLDSNPESFYQTTAKHDGSYSYNLDTTSLDSIWYQITSRLFFQNQYSPFSRVATFLAGDENVTKDIEEKTCFSIKGDLNCDGYINLTDFSIMAYWYKRYNFPDIVDLNNDGVINLSDFSIMASNWTP